jgi:hypothetical protein
MRFFSGQGWAEAVVMVNAVQARKASATRIAIFIFSPVREWL